MAGRGEDEREREEREASSPLPGDEPEPDWADEIRSLRRERSDRLKDVFSSFDEEEER